MTLPNIHSKLFRELIVFTILVIIHLVCLKYFQNFIFMGQEGRRWIPLLFTLFPQLFLFSLLRSVWTCKTALIGTITTELLFSFISWTKLKIMNEPLVWSDLSTIWDNSVLPKYLNSFHIVLVMAFLIWTLWTWGKALKSIRFKSLMNPWSFVCLLLTPVVFFPQANLLRLSYHKMDWRNNLRMNGLFYHLIQTSQKSPSLFYSETEKLAFDSLSQEKCPAVDRPKQIIFILCESCWYDEAHFKELFQPLFDRGFQSFRSVSPSYAGGTPNATFEILTGLPSINDYLKGVIYQEYATSLSNRVHTLPQYLHDEGYATSAFHNNNRTFWQRHIVNPKFGFEKYVGLEEMPPSTATDWPDDGVLFSVTLENFTKNKNQSAFLYLTTIFTHGPYKYQNDLGEASYRKKLETSISRLTYFLDQVYKEEPNTLVFIFGDHKPGLTEYFTKEGVFSSEDLEMSNHWDSVGDVPFFLKHPDSKRVQKVATAANKLPFFCSVEAIDREFIDSGLPAFSYARQMHVCENYSEKGYEYYKAAYPEWLFAVSLFEKEPARFSRIRKMSGVEVN